MITVPLTTPSHVDAPEGQLYKAVMGVIEAKLLDSILLIKAGNQVQAAKALGINRNTLRKKMKEHGLDHIDYTRLNNFDKMGEMSGE
jgi:DNA-binding NtrC family response regulator